MNRLRLAGAFALGAVSIVAIMGQSLPDIGLHMNASRDRQFVLSGCPIKWDVTDNLFKCADTGVARKTISVTLAENDNFTTVLDEDVMEESIILCGCGIGKNGQAGCNNRGRWIARINVLDVSDGEFVIEHGRSLGNERISCVVM